MVTGYDDTRILNYRFIILALVAILSPVLLQVTDLWVFKVSSDLIFGLVLIDSLVAIKKKNINSKYNKVCLMVIVIFCLYYIFEAAYAVINGTAIMIVILQFRQYKYIFLFLVILYYHNENSFNSVFNLAKAIAYISVIVSVVQRISSNSHKGDVVTGLYGFGASGIMSLFLLILFFSEFSKRIYQGKPVLGWYFLYFIPLTINETKIVFFLLPIMFIVSLMISKKASLKNLFVLLVCAGGLFYLISIPYQMFYHTSAFSYFSEEKLMAYMTEDDRYDLGRLRKVEIAYAIIDKSIIDRTYGYGIGAGYTSGQGEKLGVIAERYYVMNVFSGTRPQIFNSLIDTGLLGIALQFLFIITVGIKIVFSKAAWKMYDFTAIFSLIVWLVGFFYQDILTASNLAFFMFTSIYFACLSTPSSYVSTEAAVQTEAQLVRKRILELPGMIGGRMKDISGNVYEVNSNGD